MPKRPRSSRAERRASARAGAKLARDLERLATFAKGGSPERPIEVESPAQVDVYATSMGCPICSGALQLDEHAAETIGGHRLRVAKVVCTRCGSRRAIYFRLTSTLLS